MKIFFIFLGLGIFYILSYLQAFVIKRPFNNKSGTLLNFEVLRVYSRLFRLISLVVLAIVLFIHFCIYHGYVWAEEMFYFLLWIQDSDPNDDDDPYLSHVFLITFFTLLPYAKFSFKIVKKFKGHLFDYLKKKYSVNMRIIKSEPFFTKRLNKTNLSNYSLTNPRFRNLIISGRNSSSLRHGSEIYLDDVIFFPDKKIYMTECDITGYEEEYIEDDDGDYWRKNSEFKEFSGFMIIIEKEKGDKGFPKNEVKFYKVNNDKVLVKGDSSRKSIKHDFILDFYYRYFGHNQNIIFNKSRKFQDSKDSEVKELKYGRVESLAHFDNLQNYKDVNESLTEIAEEFDVNYVMEDSKRIYLFHQERFVDFFTFYQHRSVKVSAHAFENDFKLMLKIVNRL